MRRQPGTRQGLATQENDTEDQLESVQQEAAENDADYDLIEIVE